MLEKVRKQKKIFNFLVCGLITAAFNIAILYLLIELWNFKTPTLKNVANLAAIEISLVFTFFVYKKWVWSKSKWHLKKIFLREIPLFHMSALLTIISRSFILFPIIDWLGRHYILNTLIGIGLGSIVNYLACEKMVFKLDK
ncbi:MAG: GtrA family protein [Waterburya sp.]